MDHYASFGREILKTLENHGYSAYFVGGYVRDFLLGIPSTDIDIATSATPEQVMALFPETRETGLRFGTVTVLAGGFAYEVTTFRTDGTYRDSRHPVGVRYSETLEEDLVRRDFTVNALAMDVQGVIHDFCGGKEDLKNGILRAIGDPDTRFSEDALRILRAFRFVAKLGFVIEPATLESIARNHYRLKDISAERILQEFKYILRHPHVPQAFSAMEAAGLPSTFPELSEGIAFLSRQADCPLDPLQFFALCFHLHRCDIPDGWRFSNKEKDRIAKLSALLEVTESDAYGPELVYAYGSELCLSANAVSRYLRPGADQEERIRDIDRALPIRHVCDLAFKGQDILELTDLKDVRLIGEIVGDLVLLVLTGKLPNEYEALKEYALRKIASFPAEGTAHGRN